MLIEKWDIVTQELPLFFNLVFYVKGCALRCEGCHSPGLWNKKGGYELSLEKDCLDTTSTNICFSSLLKKYSQYVDCVLFLGGEWDVDFELYLKKCKEYSLKTALFTGLELHQINDSVLCHLDYIKVGKFNPKLGGLTSLTTNQRLINLSNNTDLTHIYREL